MVRFISAISAISVAISAISFIALSEADGDCEDMMIGELESFLVPINETREPETLGVGHRRLRPPRMVDE